MTQMQIPGTGFLIGRLFWMRVNRVRQVEQNTELSCRVVSGGQSPPQLTFPPSSPSPGSGAPEAHSFQLRRLLDFHFRLFWGNGELSFVISESPSSVPLIFCSLPPRLSPTSQDGGLEPTG